MTVVHLFNHPVVSALLLSLAFLGLVAEVRSEGFGRAGVAGLLALGLFFTSHLLEGATPWSLAVAGAGLALLRPALQDPTRRWSARTGVGVLAASVYLAMLPPGAGTMDHGRAALVLAAGALLVTLTGTLLWMRLPASLRPLRRGAVFFLPTRGQPPDDPAVAPESMVGRRGRAVTPLRPEGTALVGDERLEVTTDGEWVDEGQAVEVMSASGTRAKVRPVEDGTAVPPGVSPASS